MKKLQNIVDALNLLGLQSEAMMASNLVLASSDTSIIDGTLINFDNLFSAKSFSDKTDSDDILPWKNLISVIDSGVKSGYEVDLIGLASRLNSSVSDMAKKSGISPGTPGGRSETISDILSGNVFEDSAVDQTSSARIVYNSDDGMLELDEETLIKSFRSAISAIADSCSGEELKEIQRAIGVSPDGQLSYVVGSIYAEDYIQKSGSAWSFVMGKALPVVGLLITFPLFIKNFTEMINNAYDILFQLPLSKYGISKPLLASPSNLMELILSEIESNKDDPDSLLEILEISNVIERFWLDFIFSVTNGLMLIIDTVAALQAVELLGATVVTGGTAAPLTATAFLASTAVQVGATMGLVGAEFASEAMSETYWKRVYSNIRIIALNKVKDYESLEDEQNAS